MAEIQNGLKVQTHWKRACDVFSRLLAALEKKESPYDKARFPQTDNIPSGIDGGSLEHALFLFVVCFWMRAGFNSDSCFEALVRVFERRPDLFSPRMITPDHLDMVTEALQGEGSLRYRAEENARFWVLDLTKLNKYWGGDPRNIFKRVRTFEGICDRLVRKGGAVFNPDHPRGFLGFREKMASLLTHFFIDQGIIGQFVIPPPIDFHAMRILVATEILTTSGVEVGSRISFGKLADAARNVTDRYCSEHGYRSSVPLCDALWTLSRSFCNRHPGNDSIIGESNGRKTEVFPREFSWEHGGTAIKAYENTCLRCPIEGFCKNSVPWANYRHTGDIIIRGRRGRPPQVQPRLF